MSKKTIWDDNLGKISTLKLKSGMEIIGKIVALTDVLTSIEYPYVIVLGAEGKTFQVPYQYTSDEKTVILDTTSIQSISKTSNISIESYAETVKGREND